MIINKKHMVHDVIDFVFSCLRECFTLEHETLVTKRSRVLFSINELNVSIVSRYP